jgi:hypothetical protein
MQLVLSPVPEQTSPARQGACCCQMPAPSQSCGAPVIGSQRRASGTHSPLQEPAPLHDNGHETGASHWPKSLQAWACVDDAQRVSPSSHSPRQASPLQASVHPIGAPHSPSAVHVSTATSEAQRVWPGLQMPPHVPRTQACSHSSGTDHELSGEHRRTRVTERHSPVPAPHSALEPASAWAPASAGSKPGSTTSNLRSSIEQAPDIKLSPTVKAPTAALGRPSRCAGDVMRSSQARTGAILPHCLIPLRLATFLEARTLECFTPGGRPRRLALNAATGCSPESSRPSSELRATRWRHH